MNACMFVGVHACMHACKAASAAASDPAIRRAAKAKAAGGATASWKPSLAAFRPEPRRAD